MTPPVVRIRPTAPREVLTTREAADYLAVSTQFLEIARVKGGGPPYAKLGRLVRYRRAVLDAWLASREITSTSAQAGR